MRKMRKGFTLVELLIVIAILGALASMMTLSGTNATTSAEATKIVSNLNTMKSAAMMFFTDYQYSSDFNETAEAGFKLWSDDYFDAGTLKELRKSYVLKVSADSGTSDTAELYAGYYFAGSKAGQIKKILAARTSEYTLLKGTGTSLSAVDIAGKPANDFDTAGTAVFIRVR